jgi:flavin reductase (DIM6/NTAB) family NADH-FMN oxidoreductase RutF
VLVSSRHRGERDILAMGWHMVLMDEPSLLGCFLWDQNHSRGLIEKSKECVINVPTFDLIGAVVGIGNTHGPRPDKFETFGLTAAAATRVQVPLIAECPVSLEYRLRDDRMAREYSLFVFEVVKAHAAKRARRPRTEHYRGEGVFMVAGRDVSYRKHFKPQNL